MMSQYERAYKQLNPAQQLAVKSVDEPVLVIAGPGTGKTQLIGTRVGYILANREVEPGNILLLTFTDAAVLEMRQRLEKLIPKSAHKVQIYTYHGFANDLIRNNLEYFEGLENEPIDELAASTILDEILDSLSYGHPFKAGQYYKRQVLKFFADAKQATLSPDDIEAVSRANLKFIATVNKSWRRQLDFLNVISKKSLSHFGAMLKNLPKSEDSLPARIKPLSSMVKDSLARAINEATDKSTKPLTAWKADWLAKDKHGRILLGGSAQNERLIAAADIYRQYQSKLAKMRVYDYADMVLRAIEILADNPDFKFSLAERYQYIMLDEFQDTNPAQFELVKLLTDHPVHEGRPSILAVGDDDQAIYAFQGADYTNMAEYLRAYRGVKIVTLKQTYRSPQTLVDTSAKIANQIESRLQRSLAGISKTLFAAGQNAKKTPTIKARQFLSDAAQYAYVAKEIKRLVKAGFAPEKIAVLAPQHKYLERLIPYLQVPITYERRENILEEPHILMLIQISRLILAIEQGNEESADHLWPQVLSYELWQVPTEVIWQLVWQTKGGSRRGHALSGAVLKNRQTRPIAQFILRLKELSSIASLEEIIDGLIGIGDMHNKLKLPMQSPFFDHYFGRSATNDPAAFTSLLSNLSLLRERLRNRQRRVRATTRLPDFIDFVDANAAADINILNTSPYHQSRQAVNLLTAYAAKGREFEAVFVLACQDEVWGQASRPRSNAVKLPPNLEQISYQGMSDDERKRLFYVAVTRAQTKLYLMSYQQTLDGQRQNPLAFLEVQRTGETKLISRVLPEKQNQIELDERGHIEPKTISSYWFTQHLPNFKPKLQDLLQQQLANYRLSATHINKFIDLENAGPGDWFIYNLIGFAQAPTSTSAFGTAIHDTLSWLGNQLQKHGKLPTLHQIMEHYRHQLSGGWLRESEYERLIERGQKALKIWLNQVGRSLGQANLYEKSFGNEGVIVDGARLSGKIDRLIIDPSTRHITIVDIKTGKAYRAWRSETKLHKFAQQLMFYKLLVENSTSFRGYRVDRAFIEFFEDDKGEIVSLEYSYKRSELDDFKKLIARVWQISQNLNLPDVNKYPRSLRGIKQFEKNLIDGKY